MKSNRNVQYKYPSVEQTIQVGCELPGVRIELVLVEPITPIEAGLRLRVQYRDSAVLLKDLPDLKGYVKIAAPRQALQFVRLLTSPATRYLWWSRGNLEVEIIHSRDARTIPAFGIKQHHLDALFRGTGTLGSLSPDVYRRGPFFPPRLRGIKEGYVVERWIYSETFKNGKAKGSIQLIREIIGTDGSYKRQILKDMPPHVKGASLFIPRFE